MKLRPPSRVTIPATSTILLIVAACGLLLFRLGSLLPGLAGVEQPLPTVHASLHTLWHDPLSLPFLMSQLLVAAILPTGGYTASRLPSVVLGLMFVGLLYWLLRQWYGQRLAIFGTLLLITAPWFLHVGRLATDSIVYPLIITIILVVAAAWHKQQRPRKLLYISAVLAALVFYVPGTLWMLLPLVIIEHRNIRLSLKRNRLDAALSTFLAIILVLPLLHGIFFGSTQWQQVLGWYGAPSGVIEYLKQFVLVWAHIFVGGYHQPVYNLAPLAAVNILMALSFVVGIYLYGQHAGAARSRLLVILWLVGTALIALPGPINASLLLPIVLVLATGGIGYLLHLWLHVFPRNPLARTFGITLMAVVVVFAIAYNVREYYIAWPHNHATQQTFSRKL
jgi:hypothetical protein